jgi:hypothetical protein
MHSRLRHSLLKVTLAEIQDFPAFPLCEAKNDTNETKTRRGGEEQIIGLSCKRASLRGTLEKIVEG